MGILDRKIYVAAIAFILAIANVNGQKKLLEHSTPSDWPTIESYAFSDNGKFVKYSIDIPDKGRSMIAQASDGSWKKELLGVSSSHFADHDKLIVFKNKGDSLGVCKLGFDSISYFPQVMRFALPEEGGRDYVTYFKTNAPQDLILLRLSTGEERQFPGVEECLFSKQGIKLLILVNLVQLSVDN